MSRHAIYVVEGPDGVGKSTLAQTLVDVVGAHYMHLTYRFKDRMNLYHTAALRIALRRSRTQPVVVDRWWPSEVAYANAYRGGTRWPKLGKTLDSLARVHDVVYAFCLPHDRVRYLAHYDELKGRREELYDSGMDRVYDQFVDIHRSMKHREDVLRYDFNNFEGALVREFAQTVVETSKDLRNRDVGGSR